MAQFKDVFSTTAKVILALVIISAVCGVVYMIVGSIPIGHPDPEAACQQDTACREAKLEVERMKAESEASFRATYTKHVYLTYGDSAGDLYVRCSSSDPPTQPANQKRCKALLDRLQKDDAAQAAADAKAKAKAKADW
jgi:hypothetical protein